MARLDQLFQMTPKESPIEISCEIEPGVMSKRYVQFRFEKTMIVRVGDIDKPITVAADFRIGPKAWKDFLYAATKVDQQINS